MEEGRYIPSTFRGERKTADNLELTANISDGITNNHNNNRIGFRRFLKYVVWAGTRLLRDRELDSKGSNSCRRSIVHIVQPDVHSLI
jgi:hypothetical protein